MIITPTRAPETSADDLLAVLARPGDGDLAEIVQLAASICAGDAAGICVRDGDSCHLLVTHGIEPMACSADEAFCELTAGTAGVVTVDDVRNHPTLSRLGSVNAELARVRFYASVPITRPQGAMIARLCVLAEQPRRMSDMQLRALETLGHSASKIVELRLLRQAERTGPQPGEQDIATLVTQLSAELNHDLKVPLTGIVASLEMLQDRLGDQDDQVVRALLERCAGSANRMARMLDQHLATASHSSADGVPLCDLGSVARMLADDSATLLESMRAEVVVDDLPVVRADPDEMYSVLQNLTSNSLKFARPEVPVRILITARPVAEGWRIAVLDNGLGIPEERRRDVFSLFSRVNDEVDGHGIGLATVARIVSALGGRLGAAEAPGGGTEIWFNLPVVKDAPVLPAQRR